MQKRLILFLCLFVPFATAANGQNNFRSQPVKIIIGDQDSDPLGILEGENDTGKAAAVKAAVIVNTAGIEHTAFNLINQKRLAYGLRPLEWNEKIAAVARLHSQNMAEFSFFSHRGMDNKMVSDRADAEHIGRWSSIGENIAYNRGYSDPVAKAVELWLNSPSHRHNMLDDHWKESAVGVAVAADGSYYFTQVFLKR